MAKIILFEHDSFNGKAYVATGSLANLHSLGFGDKCSALIVIDGTWRVYKDKDYKGTAQTVLSMGGRTGRHVSELC